MLLTWTTGPGHFIKVGLLAALLLLGISIPKAHADRHPAGCTGSGLGISLFTSLPDVHIGDTIYYSVLVLNSPFPACDAGELDPASAGAITAFVVTPDGVTNAITLRRTFLAPGESDYYTNIVSYVVRAQDVRSDGTVRATAVDQGDIHQNDVNSRGGGNQGVNTQVNLPCVLITAQCVGSVGENGLITFTGTVTNCGNNTLVGVTVTNINERGTFAVLFPTNLAFGQVSSFHGSWLPLNPCLPSTALLTVLATDQFTATPRTLTNFITITCQNSLTPGIKVTKLCPSQPVPPGQLLTFSGSVTNTGNVTLTNIVVVDDRPVANTPVFALASLAPGASANFTGSYTAPTNCAATDTLTATASSVCGAAVVSSASATCPILTTPRLTVSANCSGSPVAPGGLLAYSGTVTNTGDITLTNVVVVSDQPVANTRLLTLATLAPGAGANFSGSYTVSANACSATTTVGASGQDLCNGLVAASTLPITCPITTAPAIAVTLVCPAAPVPAGGLITYTGAVRNSGNVTLNNVTVVDNQAQPSTVLSVASLAPGASANFTASFTARADACSVSSTVTATGKDNCSSAPVSNTASATCPLVTTPSIAVTQACPGTPANPGGPLAYTGTVRNSGNVTLTNVMVWNNLSGASPIFTSPILAPGQAANFSGSYVAPTNCLSTSVSTATGQSICGVSVTNSVTTSCPILTAAQISVTAVCPTTPTAPGTLLTYTGTILNRGNITVTNIVVVSDRPALNTTVFTTASLAPGASAAFTGSYTVPVDVCPVAATLKVTGKDLCSGSTVADTFVSTCSVSAAPGIAVTLACPADTSGAGINVALNGNATQSSTFVGNGFTNSASLAVDGNTDGSAFSASVAITGFEKNGWWQVDLGSIRNLRTVNVWGRSDTAFEQSSNLYLFVSDTPFLSGGLAATLAQSGVTSFYTPGYVGAPGVYSVNRTGRYLRVQLAGTGFLALTEVQAYEPAVQTNGVTLTYTGTVRNSGNVTLKNVTVVNNHPAPNTVVFTTPSLAPGVSANFTESFATPTDTCSASSTVTATGTDDCTRVPVSNSAAATCSLSTQPGIAMTLTCPPGPASPGSPLTYGGTVHNTGNVTLTNVVVLNNLSGSAPVFTSASLAPGQTANFTGSYLAPTNCSSTSIAIVTGKSICGVSVTNSATATCDVQLAPEIEVTQDCPATPVLPGGVLTYRGTVSNVGNITLTNVIVFNNRPASNTVIFTVARLAPGASANFTGSYQVPLNCCSSSSTVDATGQDICSGLTVADTYTATCTALTVPQIVVTKVCPSTLL
ncbi:MAG TPA: hypothetical protein VFE51_30565, partial [Verrucomicrobiae bacterium]|nr:hypothetical protein [Verrucomicrobiae bacterium]